MELRNICSVRYAPQINNSGRVVIWNSLLYLVKNAQSLGGGGGGGGVGGGWMEGRGEGAGIQTWISDLDIITKSPYLGYPVWQHTFLSPSAFSRRTFVSYWRKYVHEVKYVP